MNPPNKLMPWLQAIAAMTILTSFFGIIFLLLLRKTAIDPDTKDIVMPMIEVLKAVILILVGFLFGSAVSSARKDDQNAQLTAQIVGAPTPPSGNIPTLGTIPTGTPGDPVSVSEVKP